MSDERRGRARREAVAEARRLERRVEGLLERTRLAEPSTDLHLREGDLSIYAHDVAVGYRGMLESMGAFIRVVVPEEPVFAHYDAQAVEQILANLLDNAVKHAVSPEAREVEVEVRPRVTSVTLSVADRGPGMPAPTPQGTGLAVVRDLAHRMQGEVRFESREGGGTLAVVELPLTPPH